MFLEAENLNDLNSVATKLIDTLTGSTQGGPMLSFVPGVWIEQSYLLEQTFKTIAETVNCQHEAKEVTEKVNKWAKDATNGLIQSVLPHPLLPTTRFVLANALYFKGRWSQSFNKMFTRDSKFFLLDGNSMEVPFMTSHEMQFISTFDDCKVVRLPYKKSIAHKAAFSMYVILPYNRYGLWPLLEKGIGLKMIFSDQAEFNKMVRGAKPAMGLKVSQICHKSFFEVNEEGTEAAAVTAISGPMGCLSLPPPPVDFVADRPFMFLVRDDKSEMVLFMGHVINPLLG
ncbi:hypothetical protein IFM89_026552 [Coptis chinensis]|uniref:Serpin domain-containing protein n=1 Tax=Coptis chinensis TaxID=261450 RepID=A0A835LKJ6_9MAGN|nr:hypothetical protein IFM89_026552 [Coptis chinensis]